MKKMLLYMCLTCIIFVLVVSAIGLVGLKENQKAKDDNVVVSLTIKSIGNTTIESMKTENKTLLQLLQADHEIKQGSSLNQQVLCIDGVCNSGGFWWRFYVNDKLMLKKIGEYHPEKDDKILIEFGEKNEKK